MTEHIVDVYNMQAKVEVYGDKISGKFVGYGFCPVENCARFVDPFAVKNMANPRKAKQSATEKIKVHFRYMHQK